MTTAQRIFEKSIKKLEKMYGLTPRSLCRNYHDSRSVSVDGDLHAILNDYSDFLKEAKKIILDDLDQAGYFIENVNGCDFKFYAHETIISNKSEEE